MVIMKNVSMIYDGYEKPAVENINLKIKKGEFVFLVGPSGSGKSTLIRLMIRELIPTKGDIKIAGHDIIHMPLRKVPLLRRNIGCVFQDFKLLPNKTIYDNVAFALEVIGKSERVIKSQVPEVLKLVGLEGKFSRYPNELSGGEQQRVSLARAFVNRPPLLIADEPTGNLDPSISMDIMKLLDKINKTGTTVLMATHDKDLVNNFRKRVVALEHGKIIRDQARGVYGYEV
ncbi:cell division ATP-binding protein FtsE [Candidatus Oleimmundimicrobium sp.]|uniref:cell division ATP-binding protein FtsE n=1 Tax=Candidatus Oleimmundimicrobium sp. TaxID=3060597 RepID=UPI00272555EC|nr:cell division ATP-binding protein FtsE [Candidatus Oleimmundimicrobium sp.]MDO8885700.1 cell division ATP-binding protein FtsE [Candidatus Oleimmundimicrobium sp.]